MSTQFGLDRWQVSEAIYWIAYRNDVGTGPAIASPDPGCGRMFEPRLMAALEARAKGQPRSWPRETARLPAPRYPADDSAPATPAYVFRWIVKRWMRETGLDAVKLFEKSKSDLEKYEADRAAEAEQNLQLGRSLKELNGAVQAGLLVARGRPKSTPIEPRSPPPRQRIPPHFIDPPRAITAWGDYEIVDEEGFCWLHDKGPFFYDITVSIAEVKKLWPESRSESSEIQKYVIPNTTADDNSTEYRPASEKFKRDYWTSYVARYPNPDSRPSRPDQHSDAKKHFKSKTVKAPTNDDMKWMRALLITPAEWRERGRKPSIKKKNETE